MNNIPGFVRPGGKAYVSPEGIVYGTDGKLRWAVEFDQRKQPTVLWAALRKYVTLGAVVGLVLLLVQGGIGGLMALLVAMAVGAAAAGIAFVIHRMENGPIVCLLFTLDEETVSRQQVKGKTDKEKVTRAFAEWVGGQSQPSLRVCGMQTARLDCVKEPVAEPARNRIRLRGARQVPVVYVEPQQLEPVLDRLRQSCAGTN